MRKLLIISYLTLFMFGCADLSKSFSDNENQYRRGIKVTMIIATEEAPDKKSFAQKCTLAADKALDLLKAESTTKEAFLDFLRSKAMKSNLSVGYKIVLDELILTAEDVLKGVAPDVSLPKTYRDQLVKVAEFVKDSVKFYL